MNLPPHTRIIIMGTPGFVLPTLKRLLEEKAENGEPQFDLVAVYTRAPKPYGRGLGLQYSVVHKAALELQKNYRLPFEIVTPETFKDPEAIKKFQSFKPDLVIVGAYGLILPKAILDTPRLGCLNLHASLLPKLRGASPIQRAILDGEKETGVTIMRMAEGCDTGDILGSAVFNDMTHITADQLCSILSNISADLLMHVLRTNPEPKKQDHSKSSYAKKISKQEALIDWNKDAQTIDRQVRAFSSIPGAFTFIKDKNGRYFRLKVFKVLFDSKNTENKEPGTILSCDEKITVACKDGVLQLLELQMEGKKRMTGAEFSRGNILVPGDQLLDASLVLNGLNKKKITKQDDPLLKLLSLFIPKQRRPQRAAADSQPSPMRTRDR
ncbi:MAG: methionyl-tRNA formyltransferase [Alphaproteobacteria bacterium]|nr:methionyl-tRNA formyltransferase [Alphaproteobacteria bacterium]